jgi:hypothetical protein
MMGTVDVKKIKQRGKDGHYFTIDAWTTTDDLSRPWDGTIGISIRMDNEEECSYGLHVLVDEYNDRWLTKFATTFVMIPEWREQFRYRKPDRHATTPVLMPSGEMVEIDTAIADAMMALNRVGAITQFSCQGGDHSTPYILLKDGRFPNELLQTWRGANYRVDGESVYADAPLGLEEIAAKRFQHSLSDWLEGNLDETGVRYRITEKRPSSLPKLPTLPLETRKEEQHTGIQRLINKGEKAKFKDYAALRAGRDEFSKMKINELYSLVDSYTIQIMKKENFDDKAYAMVLRWVLRGLPIRMAIRKVKTDAEIASNIPKRDKKGADRNVKSYR